MTSKIAGRLAAALTLVVAGTACERSLTDLDPADFPSSASVFEDGFGPGVDFAAFQFSRVDALDIDNDEVYRGTASMRFDVPDVDDPSGGFVGGVFYSPPRDLSGYNALTFWAKSNRTIDVEELGFGLDEAGNEQFQAAITNVRLTSSWQQYAIPVPGPGSLTREGGLFYLSEANGAGAPYSIWFDEVAFADLPSVGAPQAEMVTRTVGMTVGDVVQAEIDVTVPVGGEVLEVLTSREYFTWVSSAPAVATVSESGLITKVADGTAEITALLDGAPVSGAVTVEDGDGLEGVVFDDAFGAGIGFASFDPAGGADPNAFAVDDTEAYLGNRSIRISVPDAGYAGGVFRVEDPNLLRDLSGFNALTFWAKAETAETLNEVGFGNDNTGTSQFVTTRFGLPLTTDWQRYVIPIPDPARLTAEGGLFTFAEDAENTIWFDEIAFLNLEEVGTVEPALTAGTFTLPVGETLQVEYSLSFPVDGESVSVSADARYFDWTSADPTVATVSESGVVTMVGEGSTQITATLGEVPAAGVVTVQTSAPVLPPTAPAPDPTQDAADVISIYSDSYDDVPNVGYDLYGAAGFEEVDIAGSGNSALRYTRLPVEGGNYRLIELGTDNQIDAAAAGMTNFRFDLYFPNPIQPTDRFLLKLVDVGTETDEALIDVDDGSTPPLAQGNWLSFDFALSDLMALNKDRPINTSNIQQIVIDLYSDEALSTDEVYVDNVYFYAAGDAPTEPTTAAPTPTEDAANVISMFSDAYDDVPVDTWRTGWSSVTLEDVLVDGNATKKYTDLVVAGIEAVSSPIDVTAMTHFSLDIWTPDETAEPAQLRVKLVDFGADGAFGGGDDVEHEVTLTAATTPALGTGTWVSLDIPLSDFTNLVTREHIAQLIISGDPNTLFVDNVYFHN